MNAMTLRFNTGRTIGTVCAENRKKDNYAEVYLEVASSWRLFNNSDDNSNSTLSDYIDFHNNYINNAENRIEEVPIQFITTF